MPALDRHRADTPLARLPTPVSIACVFVCDICLVAVHPAALLSFFFLPVPRYLYELSAGESESCVTVVLMERAWGPATPHGTL